MNQTPLSIAFRARLGGALALAEDLFERADPAGGAKDPVRVRAAFKAWEKRQRAHAAELAGQAKAARGGKDFAQAATLQRKADEVLEEASRRRRKLEAAGTLRPSRQRPPAPAAPAAPVGAKPMSAPLQPPPVPAAAPAAPAAPRPRRPRAKPAAVPAPKAAKPSKNPQGAIKTSPEMMARAASERGLIKQIKRLGQQGVGRTYVAGFADGTKAVYKPKRQTGLEVYGKRGNPIRETIKAEIPEVSREIAAFTISRAAGFDVVPHVEPVDYGEGEGHAQAWVEGTTVYEMGFDDFRDDAKAGHPDLHRLAALDVIIGNTDRHVANFMKGKDGRYYAIDNGLAFPEDTRSHEFRSTPYHNLEGRKIPPEVVEEIRSLDEADIRAVMKDQRFPEIDVNGAVARARAVKEFASRPKPMWPDEITMRQRMIEIAKEIGGRV